MTPENSTETPSRPLLEWLLAKYPDTPKKRAKQWISAGRVSVNGVIIRQPNHSIPDPKNALELLDRRATALDCGPDGWQIHPRVAILFLDASLAVVNKGPGLLSVPAEPEELSALGILADFLNGKLRAYDRGVDGRGYSLPPAYRRLEPLPVHRLDQYTSGVFCMAVNPKARQHLIDQLQTRTMKREYVAYVEGRPPQPAGTWRNWLKLRDDELRQFVISDAEAKAAGDDATEAITHYEVITEFRIAGSRDVVTKLRLRLETGRKHQIRAQAAHAGLPLVGDRTYHPKYRGDAPRGARIDFPRQALHAEILTLDHPEKADTRMTWTATLPRDMRQLEATLQSGRA
jgi:23S rRNA pseudouridine1911/1915/1917 synthase